jgi:hypothetical protein
MFSNKISPEFFVIRLSGSTIGMTREQKAELRARQNAYFLERKAAGLPDEASTTGGAEALRLKLEPIATKHGFTLTINRASLL